MIHYMNSPNINIKSLVAYRQQGRSRIRIRFHILSRTCLVFLILNHCVITIIFNFCHCLAIASLRRFRLVLSVRHCVVIASLRHFRVVLSVRHCVIIAFFSLRCQSMRHCVFIASSLRCQCVVIA